MDLGQIILVYSRLIPGAAAVFLAIMLWSKTRDTVWMFVVVGTIIAYIEVVCPILKMPGITAGNGLYIGSVPLAVILLAVVRMFFFITALLIMVVRRYRHQ